MRGLANSKRSTAPSNGMDAKSSAGVPLSSPAAAQRCAEGAGLDSGAPAAAQSAMPSIAPLPPADRRPPITFHQRRCTRGASASVSNLHQLDGRDQAAHVLDGLLYHQSEVAARRHHTDGGGDSDHVFALCSLLGFQFAPRIPDLKSRRLYSFGKAAAYPSLEPLIAGRINTALIRAHWPEILRVAASIHTGTVAASLILRQLASYPRQNGLAAALRELGRLERTLFTLDWLGDAELRRQTSRELNKGETRNSLARAVFIHRLGEIRDRTYENQQHRASGLNLLVTAIILWNTRYLERAVAALRQTEDVPDQLFAHLSPLGWEHVNLTGDYIWSAERPVTESRDGFRPLRAAPDTARKAA